MTHAVSPTTHALRSAALHEETVVLVAAVVPNCAPARLSSVAATVYERILGAEHILDIAEQDQSTVVVTLSTHGPRAHKVSDPALALAVEADLSAALLAEGNRGASVAVLSNGAPSTWHRRMGALWEQRMASLRKQAVRRAEDASFRREIARFLELNSIRTVFQPIVSAKNGATIGYEGLSRGPVGHRWERPDLLLGAADRAGLISLVQWEMQRLIRNRASERLVARDRLLFINAPDTRFWPEAPPETDAERASAWPWTRVVSEISERTPITNLPAVWSMRDRGRARGVQFALDDVGAGYAGLAALALLAPDYVKIDMAIVRECHRDAAKQAVIAALVQYAQRSGAVVVAEGVETSAEHDTVCALGVDLIQGFFIAPPSERPLV